MSSKMYEALDRIGRIRLSESFFFREFLYSEIAQVHAIVNAPVDLELAEFSGKHLCNEILEPLQSKVGRVWVRSGYRSGQLNTLGNQLKLNCASNVKNRARHIWDLKDEQGFAGASACIVIPRWLDYYHESNDWVSLALWLAHHIPAFDEMCFFKNQCAFNIRWYEGKPNKTIKTYIPDPLSGKCSNLMTKGKVNEGYGYKEVADRIDLADRILLP